MRLETERLIIASRTLDEMEAVRARETDPELQQVYREICALMRSQPGRDEWACDWLIARKDGTPVGGKRPELAEAIRAEIHREFSEYTAR